MRGDSKLNCCPTCHQKVDTSDLLVDLMGNCITYGGKLIRLTLQQTEIINLLWKMYPQTVSYDQIIDGISAWRDEPSEGSVKVQIFRLRKKLSGLPIGILANYGHGYRLMMGEEVA